ncbi:DMT family transporter [Solihabitans fulvus]|nr:multidrug efflux SMR transporter [Solihabitans fulvus]
MYLWLGVAIVSEIAATISLKLSESFTRLVPSIVLVVGYLVAFTALSFALKAGMAIGVAYAIWSAVGVAFVAVIGALFLGESMNLTMAGGLVLIIGGVVMLELGQAR